MALILVADDDELVRDVVREAFESFGHVVGAVSNGVEAVQAVMAKTPDLLILDCDMPGGPGISALETIRRIPKLVSLPVIMLTGSRSNQGIAAYAGANAYVTKPFQPDFLVFKAEEILEQATGGT